MPRKKTQRRSKTTKLLIKNYGLLWERRFIEWGRGKKKGHLKGRQKRSKYKVVDFREQIGIYVLYDKDLKPIYIGQAGGGENKKLFNRLKDHRKDHLANRWLYFTWFGLRRVNKNKTLYERDQPSKTYTATGKLLLDQLEGTLIAVAEPLLNKQGSKWQGAEQYYQEVDEEIRERSINQVYDAQEDIIGRFEKLEKTIRELKK